MTQPVVGIVMGSDSDWDVMQHAARRLNDFQVQYEARVVSAHRTPEPLDDGHGGHQRRRRRVSGANQDVTSKVPFTTPQDVTSKAPFTSPPARLVSRIPPRRRGLARLSHHNDHVVATSRRSLGGCPSAAKGGGGEVLFAGA